MSALRFDINNCTECIKTNLPAAASGKAAIFDINNCTECIKTNLPAAASGKAATANATTTDDAPQDNGDCTTIDGLLCDTLDSCSKSCAGSFCSNAFKDLLVCEAKFYVPDCNLTADSCPAAESGAYFAGSTWSMTLMVGILGASALVSLVS